MSDCAIDIPVDAVNPVEPYLRSERIPHIWCPGCGIGTTVNCFARALENSKANLQKVAIVSGIGCTGRVAGYADLDSFHTTHGRAIPFATGLKLANPELQVVVYSGDGDLFAIGGNHFIHAARRNMDLKVICVNNLTYAMTGGQTGPATPDHVVSTTSPYGVFEPAFNLVQLAEAAGAAYVARWTTFHVKQLSRSMEEIMKKKGFCFIEIISPCPTLYQRRNKMGDGLDTMKFYKEVSKIRHGAPTSECGLTKSGATPPAWLPHLPRFLKGISVRLTRLKNAGLLKDQQAMEIVQPLEKAYRERLAKHQKEAIADEALAQYRWLLEELRISLFAQELKTSLPVSTKRLSEQWALVKP